MTLESRSKIFFDSLTQQGLSFQKGTFTRSYLRLVAIRRVTECLIGAILIFGGQSLLVQYTFFSPLWPTTGVALSSVFLRGNFILLGIFLGSLASYISHRVPLITGLTLSLLFSAYIYVTRQLALKTLGPVAPLHSFNVLWKFIALISFMSAIHIFILFQYLAYAFSFTPTLFHSLIGWLGEINGILCLTPLCLIFDPFSPRYYFQLKNWRWWTYGLLVISCHFIYFWLPSSSAILGFSLLMFLPLTLYAKHFGQIPTCFTLLGIALFYLTGVTPTHLFQQPTPASSIEWVVGIFTLQAMMSLSIATRLRSPSYST